MQLKGLAAALGLLFAGAWPALAGTCILGLPTGGNLGMSDDGYQLGSQLGLVPLAGTLTVVSLGSSTLTIAPPSWTQTAPGYTPLNELREVAYSAGFPNGTRGYSSSSGVIEVNNIINAVTMSINVRVTNQRGFAKGTYGLRTVVTCS